MNLRDWTAGRPLAARRSLQIALATAIVSGLCAWVFLSRPDAPSDFFHYWSAARTLLDGGDPYTVIAEGPANPGHDPTLYPLPALLLLIPFALLPLAVAGGVFIGLSAGLAAYGLARTGADRLPLFLSAPFLLALSLGQWSPMLVAAALIPTVGFIVSAKPNIGLAVFGARPSRRAVFGAIALLVISLVVMPRWPIEWLANVSHREEKFVPLLRPGGFLLAASLLSWRRPEGRLLAIMSIVPQALFFYDQLLLWLVPRTLKQSLLMSIWSFGVFFVWWRVVARGDANYVEQAVPYAYSLYFPALAVLLWELVARSTRDGDRVNVRATAVALWRVLSHDDEPSPDARPVALRHRVWTAIAIGLISGAFCWLCSLRPGSLADFYFPHAAARLFLDGQNPYLVMGTGAEALAKETTLYYPFTAVLAAVPLAALPLGVASAIFLGLSAGLLAFFITHDGLWRVHVFASSSFVLTALLAQFSPLVMLMAFAPSARPAGGTEAQHRTCALRAPAECARGGLRHGVRWGELAGFSRLAGALVARVACRCGGYARACPAGAAVRWISVIVVGHWLETYIGKAPAGNESHSTVAVLL
ncbi:MAG: hypothetical protein IPP90_09560 [Gemmatimonadaceae bacterium]|nr:hypothetical protein [Gemmatimonadaceae bacterium]